MLLLLSVSAYLNTSFTTRLLLGSARIAVIRSFTLRVLLFRTRTVRLEILCGLDWDFLFLPVTYLYPPVWDVFRVLARCVRCFLRNVLGERRGWGFRRAERLRAIGISSIVAEKTRERLKPSNTVVRSMDAWSGEDSKERWIGRCKRFNKHAGWGFVVLTKSAGTQEGCEVFVHYKSLQAEGTRMKYLQEGEYVELGVEVDKKPGGESGRFAAVHVTGVDGGPLMCCGQQQQRRSSMDPPKTSDALKVYISDREPHGHSKRTPNEEQKPWYVANTE